MYLSFDIYKITMTSSQTFYCTNEKNCEKNCFFFNYPGLPLSTHRPVTKKNTESTAALATNKKKKTCERMKRVKSELFNLRSIM